MRKEDPRGEGRIATTFSRWVRLPLYDRFEQIIVFILTLVIGLIVLFSTWALLRGVLEIAISEGDLDPANHAVYQGLFGMILTVIIALEFKRSILVIAERQFGIVHVRVVVLIAMLAIVRKFIILELGQIDAMLLFGLSAAVLALGLVYWLVRDQDQKERSFLARTEQRHD